MAQHKGRTAKLGHYIGYGEGLARPRNTEQRARLLAVLDGTHQLGNRLGLVTRGLITRHKFETAAHTLVVMEN